MRPVTLLATAAVMLTPADAGPWRFTDVTDVAGIGHVHALDGEPATESVRIGGGVATGDYDGDGWFDLYFVGGDGGRNRLYRNRGDGTFEERAEAAGVALPGTLGSGPTFADLDGDGRLDLLVGGVLDTPLSVFRNLGDGTFEDVTAATGLQPQIETFGASMADYDRDGDLDVLLMHWVLGPIFPEYLWQNDGAGGFVDVSVAAGLTTAGYNGFTANFTDYDLDGWLDLLIAADFGTSRTFRSRRDGTFENTTTAQISDENGMGAAVGDYDNDGDQDWFVSSIWDPSGFPEGNWGVSGNRLYRNTGRRAVPFVDVTEQAGVRVGGWGWGACFGDFNNDGWLDLFHVNGMDFDGSFEFYEDPARLFVNQHDGTFSERSAEVGLDDRLQGRGVVCFDYDRDGDLDVAISNHLGAARLYRNDGGERGHWLQVKLSDAGSGNSEAIGARVVIEVGDDRQVRELRAGSNYASQDPAEAHFGLGRARRVDRLAVFWPDGGRTVLRDLEVDQRIVVERAAP